MRNALAKKAKANKTCPVSTGIFLRIADVDSVDGFTQPRANGMQSAVNP